MTFLRLRCLYSKSPKKSYYKINTIHPTLTSFGQKVIPGKHFWDQCINICVSMFGTRVGPVYQELDTGRVEGNFCTAALAENEVWKTKPSLSSSLTLPPASVPPALTSSMPFHVASPFLAPKSALQFLSPGPTSWYHSASATLFNSFQTSTENILLPSFYFLMSGGGNQFVTRKHVNEHFTGRPSAASGRMGYCIYAQGISQVGESRFHPTFQKASA